MSSVEGEESIASPQVVSAVIFVPAVIVTLAPMTRGPDLSIVCKPDDGLTPSRWVPIMRCCVVTAHSTAWSSPPRSQRP